MTFTKALTKETEFLHIIKTSVTDIRFWLFVFFLIRLETIDLPPLDEHAWRQCITLGVAKSYLEVDSNFLEPKTVICDSREGILAQEFPILNYIIFLLWKLFGINNWTFRIFNLSVASFGLYYFYRLVSRLFDKYVGFASTIVFGVSVAFMYARKAMPDVFAVSLCIIGIEYGYRYLERKTLKNILLFTFFLSLGLLSKMPAAVILPFGLFLFSFRKDQIRSNIVLLIGGSTALTFMILWYFVWVKWAEDAYHFPLFYPTTLKEGYAQLLAMKADFILRFYPIALTGNISFFSCILGLLAAIYIKNTKILAIFGLSILILVFFMLKTGGVFAGHTYYIIPFVPAMSLLAGYGIALLKKYQWFFYTFLLLLSTEAIVKHKSDFFIPSEDKKYLRLVEISDKCIPAKSRILVNGGNGQPRMMYFANRRGWTVDDRMKDTSWVNGESTVGLHYMIIDKSKWQDSISYKVLYDDPDYRVYKVINDE